jgi:hypothetical protein
LIKYLNIISKKLSRHDAFTLPTLSKLIGEVYTLKPVVVHLKEVYDFKIYAIGQYEDTGKVSAPLHIISFNHVFLIKQVKAKNFTLLYTK